MSHASPPASRFRTIVATLVVGLLVGGASVVTSTPALAADAGATPTATVSEVDRKSACRERVSRLV